MRRYAFASAKHKNNVILSKYEKVIKDVIREIQPKAKVEVTDEAYYLSDNVSRGDIIKIGRALASSELGRYAINRPVLFIGENANNKKDNKQKGRKRNAK